MKACWFLIKDKLATWRWCSWKLCDSQGHWVQQSDWPPDGCFSLSVFIWEAFMAHDWGTLRNIFTCRLPASHLVLILLWNKNEAISFLLLNGLLLMFLTHVFSPCGALLSWIWGFIVHPTFHTLNKYDDSVGGIWNCKYHTTLYVANMEQPRSNITASKTHKNKSLSLFQVFFPLIYLATSSRHSFFSIILFTLW